jgi:hypothetical protein
MGFCEHGNEPSGSIKLRGISRIAEELLTFQKELCSMELVIKFGLLYS